MEITIGFDDSKGNCSWHTHMSLFGAYEMIDELNAAIDLLTNIFSGKEFLVIETGNVIYLTQNPAEEIKNNETEKDLEFKKWKDI